MRRGGVGPGDELFFDSTKVEGNAAVDSLAPRWAVEAHLGELFDEQAGERGPEDLPEACLPTTNDPALRERNAAEEDWISRDGAQDRSFRVPWRERTSDRRASRTDPDATPMTWAASGRRLGYQAHYVVDGGKARVILNVLVAPAEVTENRPMLDLLWRTCFRWKLRPHHVTAEGKYGTMENVAALEEAGVRAYVALHESGSKPGFFAKGEFRYDPEADVYSCPAGKVLRPLGKKDGEDRSDMVTYYRARASECAACPLRPGCTTNKNGRQLRRYPGERHVDRVRSYRGTASYEKALRKRKVWVEPLFAEAKDWHGMRKFRLRTLRRVNAEALLVAAGQNLKRLLLFGDQRPRKPAQVAALRPPPTSTPGVSGGTVGGGLEVRRSPFCNTLEGFHGNLLGTAKDFESLARRPAYLLVSRATADVCPYRRLRGPAALSPNGFAPLRASSPRDAASKSEDPSSRAIPFFSFRGPDGSVFALSLVDTRTPSRGLHPLSGCRQRRERSPPDAAPPRRAQQPRTAFPRARLQRDVHPDGAVRRYLAVSLDASL